MKQRRNGPPARIGSPITIPGAKPKPEYITPATCKHMLADRFTYIPLEGNRILCFQCGGEWEPVQE